MKEAGQGHVVALCGNPNTGKSTLFNALTGLRQHTGNWAGKTVSGARGLCRHKGVCYVLTDLPGCYSLAARSAEEAASRDFLRSGAAEAVVVVCDATCPERGIRLALEIRELIPRVVLCVNLMDEAAKKGIHIDLEALSRMMELPVAGTSARSGKGLDALMDAVAACVASKPRRPFRLPYPPYLRGAWERLKALPPELSADEASPASEVSEGLAADPLADILADLERRGYPPGRVRDDVAATLTRVAEEICRKAVRQIKEDKKRRDDFLDRLLCGKATAFPLMFLLLLGALWITLRGANLPSEWLQKTLLGWEKGLYGTLEHLGCPAFVCGMLVQGAYRTTAWVVSVMLPPMAIFFPLFTLMEDAGFLPRFAFNLDRCFRFCHACGKQALTMCMGLGCNAAGVTGCRIIDSPRERLIAVLTNSFVPCNGKFPTMIALCAVFFGGAAKGAGLRSAASLSGLIVLGILATFAASRLLSATLLRGVPSSFTLELPPYRRPQIGRVIVRSIFDRTLFVLGRAAVVAAPAGLLLWLAANLSIGGVSILRYCVEALEPIARPLGLDGVILFAFIAGSPANEIVLPIILMAYTAGGSIPDPGMFPSLEALLGANGWSRTTALCATLFMLFHWPCTTTCLTIRKETGSLRWTAAAMILPTLFGITACLIGVRLWG